MKPLYAKVAGLVALLAAVVIAIVLFVRSGEGESDAKDASDSAAGPKECEGKPTNYYNTDPRGCGSDGRYIFSGKCQECIAKQCAGAETCQGGGFSPEQSAQCNQVLDCAADSGCNDGAFALFCYCGSVTQEECDAGKAKGTCKELIEHGLGSEDPKFIQENLLDVSKPAGRAMARLDCGNGAGCAKFCR